MWSYIFWSHDLWPLTLTLKMKRKEYRNQFRNLCLKTYILVYHNHGCQKWSRGNKSLSKSYFLSKMLNNQTSPLAFQYIFVAMATHLDRCWKWPSTNIKAYKDTKHNQGLESYLPIAVKGMCTFISQFMYITIYVYILDKFWLNDLDLSNRDVKVIWKWYLKFL